ncbi:hypothetical protein INT48_006347 [Thamnidium elegans]|uniref:DUF1212-domain-containing protein n=1 Tax=Thamnidium elegans TaxID=101142 RepID=A0A8H7SMJ3_9FUNG|nr:hypothetical protein INT48_006347 [Thamnidium elegans]
MEGSKFHAPRTPPELDLEYSQNSSVTSIAEASEKTIEASDREDVYRRPSHTETAFHLVDTVTRNRNRRKPSRAGILSNLLKLDLFEQNRSSSRHPTKSITPPLPTRPNLKSIASSRALLQSVGASPQTARNSMYFEDLHKAELGLAYDADVAAQRMVIAAEIADILQRQDLIMKIAAMDQVGKRLEIDGSYAIIPGLIIVTFGDVETHTSETHLIKCSRALDIGKLERANLIVYRIAKGELSLDEATELLDAIMDSPPTWSPLVLMLGYILSSACVAPLFFNGSWTDCWVSAIFGLVVGILTYISEKITMFGNVFEMVVTIPIAVIALALQPHVCFVAVSMAAIVIALPGYSLTCAVMELAAKNLVSGTVHLVYAVMYVFFLAFGIGYGCSIWRLIHPELEIDVLTACQESISPWWTFLLLPVATIGFGIVYGAEMKQWIPMVGDSAIGYAVHFFVGKYAGPSSIITPSTGAFALGLFGNIYSRITKRLALVPLIGGIIVLVPGSIGVRGAIHLFDGSNSDNTGSFVFQVLGIALSLTLGLFLSNLVVYPMGRKRSVFLGF